MSEPAAVELRDVFCVHRTNQGDAAALQGTNLEVRQGELVCVLGPSGAGKSTLLRVIAGLQPPSAGIVRVLGRDVGRLPARRLARLRARQLGLLGQTAELALSPDLPADRAVELPLALRGVGRRQRRERVTELIELAGLSDRAGALPRELSGGERQQFAVCAAVAHRPALLLADEPTGELDDASAARVLGLIAELARSSGGSAIIVSHDPATAAATDRAVRIRDGRVVEEQSDGRRAAVIDERGWLHVPPELLRSAGIGRRAQLTGGPEEVVLRPEPGSSRAERRVAPGPPTPDSQPARVELHAACRSYGSGRTARRVLDRLEHAFPPGALTVVTGRSGTGKTTLLKLLAGLDRPDGGEVVIDGVSLGGRTAEQLAELRRARIGYMPQEPNGVGFLSAEENIVLGLALRGHDRNAAAARASAALAATGLGEQARQRVSRLSAGETQRVALARALAAADGLLILDEPTSRLDEANAGAVARLLAEAAARGQTVICSTHDPVVIAQADAKLVLGGGPRR